MKKVFLVGKLNDSRLKSSILEEAQVLAYRADDLLYYQNLEFYPTERCGITFNPKTGDVTLKFRLHNGEFLAVGSESGMADKHKIENKKD